MNFPQTLEEYAAARDELLNRIVKGLEADPRVAAAWLIGSIGRGAHDQVSDVDLLVALYDPYRPALCNTPRVVAGSATPARLALFSAYGDPVNIHENHHNAPLRGSFSAVLYRNPPVMVDWTLVARTYARPADDARLLFEREAPPNAPDAALDGDPAPEEESEEAQALAERRAFFWMTGAVTAKYIVRGHKDVSKYLKMLADTAADIDMLQGRVPELEIQPRFPTRQSQVNRLRALLDRIARRREPRIQVDAILNLADDVRVVE